MRRVSLNSDLKIRILELRGEGKSYNEIVEILKCSKSIVSYYCGKGVKAEQQKRLLKRNAEFATRLKIERGGKCERCGYDKCLAALHFHHRNPKEKTRIKLNGRYSIGINDIAHYKGHNYARLESEKCELLCANCHAEEHEKIKLAKRLARGTHE